MTVYPQTPKEIHRCKRIETKASAHSPQGMHVATHHLSALGEITPRPPVSLEIKLPTFNASLDGFRGRVRARDSGPGLELERARYVEGGVLSEAGAEANLGESCGRG